MAGRGLRRTAPLLAALLLLAAGAAAARVPRQQEKPAAKPLVPPEVARAVEQIYEGNPDQALLAAASFEKQHPGEPLGYLLEAEARWWKLYCAESEIRYGMVDVWKLPKPEQEPPYLAAARKAVALAEAELAKGDSAPAELWAGMAYALEARIYGLRGERRATARAGVRAREHLLKASQLDPSLGDAYTGLGLYNYYVDALSPLVKLLRFFLGIPGGSKREGVRQLRRAMEQGQLTAVEARFYLAKNLRTYDHNYAEALQVARPLLTHYPQNPIFLLLVANLELELGHREQAAKTLSAIGNLKIPDSPCAQRAQRLARQLLHPAP